MISIFRNSMYFFVKFPSLQNLKNVKIFDKMYFFMKFEMALMIRLEDLLFSYGSISTINLSSSSRMFSKWIVAAVEDAMVGLLNVIIMTTWGIEVIWELRNLRNQPHEFPKSLSEIVLIVTVNSLESKWFTRLRRKQKMIFKIKKY